MTNDSHSKFCLWLNDIKTQDQTDYPVPDSSALSFLRLEIKQLAYIGSVGSCSTGSMYSGVSPFWRPSAQRANPETLVFYFCLVYMGGNHFSFHVLGFSIIILIHQLNVILISKYSTVIYNYCQSKPSCSYQGNCSGLMNITSFKDVQILKNLLKILLSLASYSSPPVTDHNLMGILSVPLLPELFAMVWNLPAFFLSSQ